MSDTLWAFAIVAKLNDQYKVISEPASLEHTVRELGLRLLYFGAPGVKAREDLQSSTVDAPWEIDLKMMMKKRSRKGQVARWYHISLYPVDSTLE